MCCAFCKRYVIVVCVGPLLGVVAFVSPQLVATRSTGQIYSRQPLGSVSEAADKHEALLRTLSSGHFKATLIIIFIIIIKIICEYFRRQNYYLMTSAAAAAEAEAKQPTSEPEEK